MDEKPLFDAILEAKAELDIINERLAILNVLHARRAQLDDFIKVASSVLQNNPLAGEYAELALRPVREVQTRTTGEGGVAIRDDRLWEAIQFVMTVRNKPLSAGEVLELLAVEGIQVQGVHKRETVRNAMSRQTEVFERVGRGLFALKEWSDSVKYSRNNDQGLDIEARLALAEDHNG